MVCLSIIQTCFIYLFVYIYIAKTGVVHVLEKPILPKHKDFYRLSARKSLIGMNCTRFIKLFDKNGLGAYLDDTENDATTTILAPSNDGISLPSSKKDVTSWLKYHILHGRWDLNDLHDGQLLETETHHDLGQDSYQRIEVHQEAKNKPIRFGKSAVLGDPGIYLIKIGFFTQLLIFSIVHSVCG